MRKEDAIAALRSEADAAKALGATAMYLFGSMQRDEAGARSDIDLFIDTDAASRFSLVELVGLKQLLERRLGVPVDLTTRESLDPLLRPRIEASAERVFDGASRSSGASRHHRGDRGNRKRDARQDA